MKRLIALSMICLMNIVCSCSILAKKQKTRAFAYRGYRFCSEAEVSPPWGKLCYRTCLKTIFNRCVETRLIVEDLSQPETHKKFLYNVFSVRKTEFD